MSLLSPDDQLSELRGRVAELEARVSRVEGAVQLPATPRFVPTSLTPPVASPPPVSPVSPTEWPSRWTPAAAPEAAPFISPDAAQNWEAKSARTASSPSPVAPSPSTEPGSQTNAVPPPWPSREPHKDKSLLDWETLVGGRLALWVGALCLFLALASLLVYVGQTLPPPTPLMRVGAGFAASFALFAGALWARNRMQLWFVDGFLGAGLAVGFLSVWGGGPHFALWSWPVSVAGFSLFSALGVALAAKRNSPALLILSATGGFLTPLLVHHNNSNGLPLVFLSYLLVLNAGIVAVCVAKKWREIIYGAFAATVLLAWGWSIETNIETTRLLAWVFASLGWILFAGAACVRAFWKGEDTDAEDSTLLFSVSGLYALASHSLLAPLLRSFPGAFSLGLTVVFGALWFVSRQRLPLNAALRTNFLALACVAGALFVPLQFGQNGLVWGWMAQSVALTLVGRKTNARLLSKSGKTLWVLAMLSLAVDAIVLGTSAPFDWLSLRILFCLGATAILLFDASSDDSTSPLYATVLSWVGAFWIGRAVWLALPRFATILPAHRTEAAILIGASVIALWCLGMFRAAVSRSQNELRANALLVFGSALCAIVGVALYGQAPLVALRIAAFAAIAASLWLMGNWLAPKENATTRHELSALAVASWLLLGFSVEVAAHWNRGVFAVPASGMTTWFALCAAWCAFAALVGALSIWRAWPKLWALAEGVFAVSTGVLLLQSLLVLHPLAPITNARLGAFALAWLVALLARVVDGEGKERRGDWWLGALLLLPLWASTQEGWNLAATHHADLGKEWQRFASLGVSLWWSFYAAAGLIAGVLRRTQGVRVGALALGALTVCKVFLLDLSFLDGGLRVLSLGGLGLALMLISWLYSRLERAAKAT